MVTVVLHCMTIVVAFVGLCYKLNHLRRDTTDRALMSLCLVFLFSLLAVGAGAFFAGHPVAFVFSTCMIVLSVTNEQILLTYWTSTARSALSKVHEHLGVGLVLVVLLVTMFVTGQPWHTGAVLYALANTAAQTRIALLSLRHTKKANTAWLRSSLRAVSAGAVLTLGDSVGKVIAVASGQQEWATVAVLSAAAGATVKMIGWTMPAWGPSIAEGARLLTSYRDYRRMRSLWLALYQANPHIALDEPEPWPVEAFSVRDIGFRTYRRVIEIRDGVLALRPYMDPDTIREATLAMLRQGIGGRELEATVDAIRIDAALRRKLRGLPCPGTSVNNVGEHLGGEDILGERRWLSMVSAKFAALR